MVFTRVRVTASPLGSPGLILEFSPISAMFFSRQFQFFLGLLVPSFSFLCPIISENYYWVYWFYQRIGVISCLEVRELFPLFILFIYLFIFCKQWYQVFQPNTSNFYKVFWFQVFQSNINNYMISRNNFCLIIIICLNALIWSEVTKNYPVEFTRLTCWTAISK